MDLLGDLGLEDQLTSVRSENAILHQRVKDLTAQVAQCKLLQVENAALKAEVEIYRQEMALPNFSQMALGQDDKAGSGSSQRPDAMIAEGEDFFERSGNGDYPKKNEITLYELHGPHNNLTCAISPDDVIVASGGADGILRLVPWGAADEGGATTAHKEAVIQRVLQEAAIISCAAPVIAVEFSPHIRHVLALGCMDGSVSLVHYESKRQRPNIQQPGSSSSLNTTHVPLPKKHVKYIRNIAWSTKEPVFATSSADGCIYLYKVEMQDDDTIMMTMSDDEHNNNNDNDEENTNVSLTASIMDSLHLSGPIEAMCFVEDFLICHVRGTPYLTFFDLSNNMKQTKINLNQQEQQQPTTASSLSGGGGSGGFATDHVSFTILDLRPYTPPATSRGGSNQSCHYLAAATDMSRNIILTLYLSHPPKAASGGSTGIGSGTSRVLSCRIIRNLYGHLNDGYSQPKVSWSLNGQYLLGNTQDDSVICVWDIASQQLVQRLPQPQEQQAEDGTMTMITATAHTSPIRDLCTGNSLNFMVTTSFDKSTRLWFSDSSLQ